MSTIDIPFNLKILHLTQAKLRGVGQVSALDYFATGGGEFHEQGLFSIATFGPVGDPRRDIRFGYVDLKTEVFHPLIFKALTALKRFYGEILEGKKFATWNAQAKDFEPSTPLDGHTGYHFFLQHWRELEFKSTGSDKREDYIKTVTTYTEEALGRYVVVLPAGLRDLEVGPDGRPTADEINDFYRKLISISNTVTEGASRNNPEIIDTVRYRLQMTFNALYEHIEGLIKGKKKLYMGKWASRRVHHGTRNVITAMIPTALELGQPGAVNINNTLIGLHQMLVAVNPVAKYLIKNGIISHALVGADVPARLINKKTLLQEEVALAPEDYDRWMTKEGLDKVLSDFSDSSLRHRAVELQGYYVALVYRGADDTFRVLYDIRELPPERSRSDVKPITMCELLYLSVYQRINTFPLNITRYPVAGAGSIYPSFAYVKTTTISEKRTPLNENWEPDTEAPIAYEFPIAETVFYDSVTPHTTHLSALGGDYDGDMVTANALFVKDSVDEITTYLSERRAYIGTDGRYKNSTSIPTIDLVMHNLTGD